MDVKIVFLYSDLEKEIYMLQFKGFEVIKEKNMVSKLNKSLYSLK